MKLKIIFNTFNNNVIISEIITKEFLVCSWYTKYIICTATCVIVEAIDAKKEVPCNSYSVNGRHHNSFKKQASPCSLSKCCEMKKGYIFSFSHFLVLCKQTRIYSIRQNLKLTIWQIVNILLCYVMCKKFQVL